MSTRIRRHFWAAARLHQACVVVVFAGALTNGCSTNREPGDFFQPEDVGTLVVDALLQVGRPLPRVIVTRALSPAVPYSPEAAAESNARVRVRQLPDGPTIDYAESEQTGVYRPIATVIVQANSTYELLVFTTANELVRAQTITPDAFSIAQWLLLDDTGQSVVRELATFDALGDSVYFAPENQLVYADGLLEARFVRPDVLAFQVGIFSLDPDSDFVIEPEFFDPEDFESIDRQEASPAFEIPDGTLRLPWFTIFFAGRYKITVLALDLNASDWVRSFPQDDSGFSFGGTLGDNFERPIFHVDGGIGLFGSASTDSIGFFVHPRPQP